MARPFLHTQNINSIMVGTFYGLFLLYAFSLFILQLGKLRARKEVTYNGHAMYLISILLLQVEKKWLKQKREGIFWLNELKTLSLSTISV